MPEIRVSRAIFNEAYLPYLDCHSRTQVFYGGASSGKSVFVAQRAVFDVLNGGRNYLVCRQVARTLKRSVFAEVVKVIVDWGVAHLFDINNSDMTITCTNDFQIVFVGLDDVQKLKSITPKRGVFTDVWVEEATETERASVKQLYKRQRGGSHAVPKRLTLTFNPIILSHWIYTDYFSPIAWADDQFDHSSNELSILKTTYKDNRFLTLEDRQDLEGEADPYFRDVYTLGKWGVLGNVIFTNWQMASFNGERAQFTNHRFGLDFGFSTDPAAVVLSHYDRKNRIIYVYDELYERGLTNDVLAEEVVQRIGQDYVVCDSAEPKSITELQLHGVSARPARKGKDSVLHGIQWLKQHQIVIAAECVNTRNEFQQYKWKEDKDGNALRQPLDKHNHLIDALRYAYEDDMMGGEGLEAF